MAWIVRHLPVVSARLQTVQYVDPTWLRVRTVSLGTASPPRLLPLVLHVTNTVHSVVSIHQHVAQTSASAATPLTLTDRNANLVHQVARHAVQLEFTSATRVNLALLSAVEEDAWDATIPTVRRVMALPSRAAFARQVTLWIAPRSNASSKQIYEDYSETV